MAEDLKKELGADALNIELIEGARSTFEITLDGELIFSRLQTGRFPEPDSIRDLIKGRIQV